MREREREFTISQEHAHTYKKQRKSDVRPKFFNLHILIKPKSMQLKIRKRLNAPINKTCFMCLFIFKYKNRKHLLVISLSIHKKLKLSLRKVAESKLKHVPEVFEYFSKVF